MDKERLREGVFTHILMGDKKVCANYVRTDYNDSSKGVRGLALFGLKAPHEETDTMISDDEIVCFLAILSFKTAHSVDTMMKWLSELRNVLVEDEATSHE